MHGWYGDGHMGWMSIGWIFGLALIVALVWALLRASRRPGGTREPRESAEDVLQRRYAKGEIDRDTYQRMLRDLKG
jgi:putative membrane protein